ncbi:MAG: NAD(P)/FAD-dependent oxidoreductase [Candidatus Micrarchaeota archaeon]|nr:NAD(P)/FAD-dependent oxidoreductase [Candidatus Micrarchaeota archaeon]
MKHDVIIVGAGISGLLTALSLAKEGKNILLLEKEKEIGGICRSYRVGGYRIDTGPHIITRLKTGPFRVFMDKYFDAVPEFVEHGKYYLRFSDSVASFPWTITDWLVFSPLSKTERVKIVQAMAGLLVDYATGNDLNNKSIGEVLRKYHFSERALHIANALSLFLAGTTSDKCPIGRFVGGGGTGSSLTTKAHKLTRLIKDEGSKEQGYPKGGLQSIVNCITQSMPETCQIKTGCEVKKIIVEDGRAKGVATKDCEYYSDTVVYAGYAGSLPDLLPLRRDYAKRLKSIEQATTLSVWLGLNKRYFGRRGSEIWVETEKPGWVVPTSNYDPSLAPAGKQLAGFVFVLSKDEQKQSVKKLGRRYLSIISGVFPEIEGDIDMVHAQIQRTESIMVGQKFPSQKTPVTNLYFVGKETESPTTGASIGVSKAAHTVLECLRFMKKDGVLG